MNSTIMKLASDEKLAWEKILKLRSDFHPELVSKVRVRSKEEALERGVRIIKSIFHKLQTLGIDLRQIEPGHGIGHIIGRDYINALVLAKNLDADPKEIFIGLISGAVHEIGTALVDRYADSKRAVRHGEMGAILLDRIFSDKEFSRKLNRAEKILICYAVAAHTHYLKPMDVTCEDSVIRRVEPYIDAYPNGQPILAVWIARWIDRLDLNGPAFVGRHFLTLSRTHSDLDGNNFYSLVFANHMLPLLREEKEIKAGGGNRTMLEHLVMYAGSQKNESAYGKHDFGAMVALRDAQTKRLWRIIEAVQKKELTFDAMQEEIILTAWTAFLGGNIEPTDKGVITAMRLKEEFKKLDGESRRAWLNGFIATMKEYIGWANEILDMAEEFPPEWFYINTTGIKQFINPLWSWENIVTEI